jgi:broad specificity phosphatase PhoE
MDLFPRRRRIFLMRHGEVNYFEEGRPVPPPEARLNAEGREQAHAAALALATVPFDRAGGRVIDLPRDELREVFLNSLTHHLSEDSLFLRGERFGDFAGRVVPAFQTLATNNGWQNMLIVAHGAVNRAILADVLHAPVEAMGHLEQDAGCINRIDIDERGYGIVRLLNYTPYNQTKQGMDLTTMERYFLEFPEG